MSEISETSSSAISTYIDNKTNDGYSIKFTLANINFSMANALRRIILTDIPIVAFKTFPHEENLSVFHTNTTRLNNEILRQRLECIPVYIKDPEINLDELEVEINVKNIGNIMRTVTTKDFKIKDLKQIGIWPIMFAILFSHLIILQETILSSVDLDPRFQMKLTVKNSILPLNFQYKLLLIQGLTIRHPLVLIHIHPIK